MKRTIKLLALAAALAVFAVPVLAQTKECTDEFKSATYQKWYDNRKDHQDVAFQAADEYLAVCPNDDSPYKTAIKKFWDAYKVMKAGADTTQQFDDAVKQKKYAEQIRLGKQILASTPDAPAVVIIMGVAGLGDASLLSESAQYAKQAIELVEAGKPVKPVFDNKDQALAYLNYVIAKNTLKNAPADAIPYLLKVARVEGDLKKNRQQYVELAGAYAEGPVAKLTDLYKRQTPNNVETPESKVTLENLNQAIDREIDAFARAAALSTNAADKKAVMDQLTDLYKYRNKSEAGLNELIARVLSQPLPDVPTPISQLPTTPTPASTPATNSGTNGGSTGGSSTGGTKPAGNNMTTGGANTGGTKTGSASVTGTQTGTRPAATPTPTPTKRPRSNHRRA